MFCFKCPKLCSAKHALNTFSHSSPLPIWTQKAEQSNTTPYCDWNSYDLNRSIRCTQMMEITNCTSDLMPIKKYKKTTTAAIENEIVLNYKYLHLSSCAVCYLEICLHFTHNYHYYIYQNTLWFKLYIINIIRNMRYECLLFLPIKKNHFDSIFLYLFLYYIGNSR